ncbi:hypothetical protein [Nonomuraea salmonea]|uniref:PE domain-containing protein n=1 Tax=Nonomuraea salmonea TaxID=46181 RepID=A0ABV5NFI6_9ACTN
MGTDRGVDLSKEAIKAARRDLLEALKQLAPEKAGDGVSPAFAPQGGVNQLTTDSQAMYGFWPAAMGFQASANNGIAAVTASYENIVSQLKNAIDLLEEAVGGYDGVEKDSSERSNTMRV